MHIVRFDSQNQIQQVKIYWDQGSLLKQVEIIGARGRTWPIRDANDQSKAIVDAARAVAPAEDSSAPAEPKRKEQPARPASVSLRQPWDRHGTLNVADSLSPEGDDEPPVDNSARLAAAKSRMRDYNELFIGDADEESPRPKRDSVSAGSKTGTGKNYGGPVRVLDPEAQDDATDSPVQPKGGLNKNFHPVRVLDAEGNGADSETPSERKFRGDPKKYEHFELGDNNDGSREIKDVPRRTKGRHMSQWDFSDFSTPQKPKPKVRSQDVRHFGWSDDEEDVQATPPARARVIQPRRDAETHFRLADDEPEAADAEAGQPRRAPGAAVNKGLGLYENNLFNEDGTPVKQHHGIVPNGAHRKKDFDSHWALSDASPPEGHSNNHNNNQRPLSNDRAKVVQMMNRTWDTYDDESPEPEKPATVSKASLAQKRSSRPAMQASWSIGDDDDE